LSVQTVYFWADLHAGLAEIARVLVPGGRLALGIMPKDIQHRVGFSERGYNVLDGGELAAALEEASFSEVSAVPVKGPRPCSAVVLGHKPPHPGRSS
jgi:arsenite methyltransferase